MPDRALFAPSQSLEDEPSAFSLEVAGRELSDPVGGDNVIQQTVFQIVSLRSPQYGIPLAVRLEWMRVLIPNGTPSYVGLYSVMPGRDGIGGEEASGNGYARVSHSNWRDVVVAGFVARRANTGEIRATALTGDLTVVGWGIWNAATDGDLLGFGLLRNVDGTSRIFELGATDEWGWTDGALQVGVQ